MASAASTLMFGREHLLLQTRAWVLEQEGFPVMTVTTLAELAVALSKPQWEVLILCHTISAAEHDTACSLVTLLAPGLPVLVLDAGHSIAPGKCRETVRVLNRPTDLLAAVRSMFDPVLLSQPA